MIAEKVGKRRNIKKILEKIPYSRYINYTGKKPVGQLSEIFVKYTFKITFQNIFF